LPLTDTLQQTGAPNYVTGLLIIHQQGIMKVVEETATAAAAAASSGDLPLIQFYEC